MASFAVTLEELSSDICASFQNDLKTVLDAWEIMGLSDAQVKERQLTVIQQISDVTKAMVKEEETNQVKLTKMCDEHFDKIIVLWSELECEGDFRMEEDIVGFSLLRRENYLRKQLDLLHKEKVRRLEEEKVLIKENSDLSSLLGIDCVQVVEKTLLTGRQQLELENHIEGLKKMKEERENQLFIMREEIICLIDQLEIGGNTTSSNDSIVVANSKRLRMADLLTVQDRLEKLKKQLVDKQMNAKMLVQEIVDLYDKLDVPSTQRLPLATGQVCQMEELYKLQYLSQLEDELKVMKTEKQKHIKTLVENARRELNETWQKCFIPEEDRGDFVRRCAENTDDDDKLEMIEDEIRKLAIYYDDNYEMLSKYRKLKSLWESVEDLDIKSRDPNRLFNSRGNALFKEEKERKQVGQMLPKIEKELNLMAQEELAKSGQVLSIRGVPLVDILKILRIRHANQLKNISLDVKVFNKLTLDSTTLNNNKSTMTNSSKGKQTPTAMNSPMRHQNSSISRNLHRPNLHRTYSPVRPRATIPQIQVIESTPKDFGFPGASSTFIGSNIVEKSSNIFDDNSVLHAEGSLRFQPNSIMGRRYSTVNTDDSTFFLLQDSAAGSVAGTTSSILGRNRKGAVSSKSDVAGKKKFGFSFKKARLGELCAAGRRTLKLNSILSSASSKELGSKIMTSKSTVV